VWVFAEIKFKGKTQHKSRPTQKKIPFFCTQQTYNETKQNIISIKSNAKIYGSKQISWAQIYYGIGSYRW
jgi:hypothetical protein